MLDGDGEVAECIRVRWPAGYGCGSIYTARVGVRALVDGVIHRLAPVCRVRGRVPGLSGPGTVLQDRRREP